jgi:hypothetical protein
MRAAAVARLLIIGIVLPVKTPNGPGSQLREVLISSNFDEGQAALQGWEYVEQTKRPSASTHGLCRAHFEKEASYWIHMNVRSSLTTTR